MKENDLKSSVSYLREEFRRAAPHGDDRKGGGGGDNSGGNGGGSALEQRVGAVEKAISDIRERLARVETKLDNVDKHMATKTDLEALRGSISTDVQKSIADATWRFVQISVVLAGLAFTAAKFIH